MTDPKETSSLTRDPVDASLFFRWLLGTFAIPLGMGVVMIVYHEQQPFSWCERLTPWSQDALVYALHGQLGVQLLYCIGGIVYLRGWRWAALVVSILALWITCCAGVNAAMAITGGWF